MFITLRQNVLVCHIFWMLGEEYIFNRKFYVLLGRTAQPGPQSTLCKHFIRLNPGPRVLETIDIEVFEKVGIGLPEPQLCCSQISLCFVHL